MVCVTYPVQRLGQVGQRRAPSATRRALGDVLPFLGVGARLVFQPAHCAIGEPGGGPRGHQTRGTPTRYAKHFFGMRNV